MDTVNTTSSILPTGPHNPASISQPNWLPDVYVNTSGHVFVIVFISLTCYVINIRHVQPSCTFGKSWASKECSNFGYTSIVCKISLKQFFFCLSSKCSWICGQGTFWQLCYSWKCSLCWTREPLLLKI